MKTYLAIIFFMPLEIFAQQIVCMDTVTTNGYFYRIKDNRLASEAFERNDKYFYFSPEHDIKSKGFIKIINYMQSSENDTVKYLSYKPNKDISMYITPSCQTQFANVIDIQPFSIKNKLYKIKGYKRRQIQISYATVNWLHLRVRKDVACGEGFDRPASLFCDSSIDRFFDIYVPLELLKIDNAVQLKKSGVVIHSSLK